MEPILTVVGALADVIAQSGVDWTVQFDPFGNLLRNAVGSFVTTLVVGAIMIAAAEEYTVSRMAALVEDPVRLGVYGIVCLVFILLVTIVLVITIIGILVAIPFAIAAFVVWAIGSAIAFLAIAERIVDREDGWGKPLLVAAALNGGLALTGIGGIVSFAVGAAGFGAVLKPWIESREG